MPPKRVEIRQEAHEQVREWVARRDQRVSPWAEVVLACLWQLSRREAPTSEEVHETLRKSGRALSLKGLTRALERLEDAGLIRTRWEVKGDQINRRWYLER